MIPESISFFFLSFRSITCQIKGNKDSHSILCSRRHTCRYYLIIISFDNKKRETPLMKHFRWNTLNHHLIVSNRGNDEAIYSNQISLSFLQVYNFLVNMQKPDMEQTHNNRFLWYRWLIYITFKVINEIEVWLRRQDTLEVSLESLVTCILSLPETSLLVRLLYSLIDHWSHVDNVCQDTWIQTTHSWQTYIFANTNLS